MTAGEEPTCSSGEIRGDLLSCYLTATAALLAAHGIDHNLAIGGQLFLGLRQEADRLQFLHYHTPLAGDGELYRIDLQRHGTADPFSAGKEIAEEAARTGIVLVTGSTSSLPWLDRGDAEPTPHWFVVRPSGENVDLLDVDDRFIWVDEYGEHVGFQGSVPRHEVGKLAHSPLPVNTQQGDRERWALGDRRDRPEWSELRPWQWWECESVMAGDAEAVEAGRVVLERTVQGVLIDTAVRDHGWTTGRAVFEELAEVLDAGLSEPDSYRCNTDLWVALRTRQFFAVGLGHAWRTGVADGLSTVHSWVEAELVPAWTSVVRAMRYNALRVGQNLRPHVGVLEEIRRIGALEDEARGRLAAALSGT